MKTFTAIAIFVLVQAVSAQNVYCLRVVGHTPQYERILLLKDSPLAARRTLYDLGPVPFPDTNRIDRLFADVGKERTNRLWTSCLSEVPVKELSLKCSGGLLSKVDVSDLLGTLVAVPRTAWTNHAAHGSNPRYVFSLCNRRIGEFVIDERPGGCAIVYFPDGTYRCIMDSSYSCLKPLQPDGTANRSQPSRSETNRTSSTAGSGR
jgi:hypothetical protein